MKVIWSDEAVADYHQNIDYILGRWSDKVAMDFIEDIETTIELIKRYPELYPLADYHEVHKAVITKQITLFFKIKNNEIQLIRFWNNYQDPQNLKI